MAGTVRMSKDEVYKNMLILCQLANVQISVVNTLQGSLLEEVAKLEDINAKLKTLNSILDIIQVLEVKGQNSKAASQSS